MTRLTQSSARIALSLLLASTAGCGGGTSASSAAGSSTTTPNSAYNNLNPNVLPPGVNVPSQAVVNKNAQAFPGWQLCVGACANGAAPSSYALAQNLATPSLNNDGEASSYAESGTPFGDVMWYDHFGDATATHFVVDLYLMIDHPENAQALEIAALKNDGPTWYKMEVQCDYQSGALRGFNEPSFAWTDLGANCVPDKANTWQRITLQFSTTGGTTNYLGVSFDGVPQAMAVSLPPATQANPSELLGVHFQLDNANTLAGYTVYVDDWTVYSW